MCSGNERKATVVGVQVATEPFRLAVTDPALEQRIRDGLGAVEELLRASARSDHPFIAETASHLVNAGGKRFRPLLTLLAAETHPASCRRGPSSNSPTWPRSTTTT